MEELDMARSVYVDVSWSAGVKRRRAGWGHPHVVFDGERFYEVDRLTKLKMLRKSISIHYSQQYTPIF
jgi:2-hydroxychromene-2-carboxylate isomerase